MNEEKYILFDKIMYLALNCRLLDNAHKFTGFTNFSVLSDILKPEKKLTLICLHLSYQVIFFASSLLMTWRLDLKIFLILV
jgi:hypothetical protein